jgi:hypothetical protein
LEWSRPGDRAASCPTCRRRRWQTAPRRRWPRCRCGDGRRGRHAGCRGCHRAAPGRRRRGHGHAPGRGRRQPPGALQRARKVWGRGPVMVRAPPSPGGARGVRAQPLTGATGFKVRAQGSIPAAAARGRKTALVQRRRHAAGYTYCRCGAGGREGGRRHTCRRRVAQHLISPRRGRRQGQHQGGGGVGGGARRGGAPVRNGRGGGGEFALLRPPGQRVDGLGLGRRAPHGQGACAACGGGTRAKTRARGAGGHAAAACGDSRST